MDDNDAILRLLKDRYPFEDAIKSRLAIGLERYGHGVRVMDDTTQWGTKTNSWLEMGLEEIDDLAIYVAAQMCRNGDSYPYGVAKHEWLLDSLTKVRKQIVDLLNDEVLFG